MLSLAALVAGAALGLLSNLAMAKLLGPAGTGAVLIALTVAGIGGTVARAGLDMVALRLAAISYQANDVVALGSLYRATVGLALLLGTATTALIAGVVMTWSPFLNSSADVRTAVVAASAAIPAASALIVQGEFLKARQQPSLANAIVAALPPALVIVGLGLLTLLQAQSAGLVAGVHTVATFLAATLAALLWHRRAERVPRSAVTGPSAASLLRSGVPFLWLAFANMAIMWTDIIVLGIWTDPATVGIYGMAQRVAVALTFFLLAANSVTAPRFAALHAAGEHAALERLAASSAFWLAVAAAPPVAALLLLPETVMSLFGADFVSGYRVLQILVIGQSVNIMTGSVGYLLMMTGHERALRNIVVLAGLTNLVGNLVLVPRHGMIGAAIATASSLALMNVAAYFAVRRSLRIDTLGYLKRLADRLHERSAR